MFQVNLYVLERHINGRIQAGVKYLGLFTINIISLQENCRLRYSMYSDIKFKTYSRRVNPILVSEELSLM